MTVDIRRECPGVDVHFTRAECELFLQLAEDADQVAYTLASPTYLSLCVKLGRQLAHLMETRQPDWTNHDRRALKEQMIALVLAD